MHLKMFQVMSAVFTNEMWYNIGKKEEHENSGPLIDSSEKQTYKTLSFRNK